MAASQETRRRILAKLGRAWEKNPDLSLGQLTNKLINEGVEERSEWVDPFYTTDEELERALNESVHCRVISREEFKLAYMISHL